jgi:hypothetical protein
VAQAEAVAVEAVALDGDQAVRATLVTEMAVAVIPVWLQRAF